MGISAKNAVGSMPSACRVAKYKIKHFRMGQTGRYYANTVDGIIRWQKIRLQFYFSRPSVHENCATWIEIACISQVDLPWVRQIAIIYILGQSKSCAENHESNIFVS